MFRRDAARQNAAMRLLAFGIAIAVLVWIVSGGHVLFLPLLFLPLGLFSFGHRRSRR
jgi:hypothetical protein